jgi:hypothetical protein
MGGLTDEEIAARKTFGSGMEIGRIMGEVEAVFRLILATAVCDQKLPAMIDELCYLSSKLARETRRARDRLAV